MTVSATTDSSVAVVCGGFSTGQTGVPVFQALYGDYLQIRGCDALSTEGKRVALTLAGFIRTAAVKLTSDAAYAVSPSRTISKSRIARVLRLITGEFAGNLTLESWAVQRLGMRSSEVGQLLAECAKHGIKVDPLCRISQAGGPSNAIVALSVAIRTSKIVIYDTSGQDLYTISCLRSLCKDSAVGRCIIEIHPRLDKDIDSDSNAFTRIVTLSINHD